MLKVNCLLFLSKNDEKVIRRKPPKQVQLKFGEGEEELLQVLGHKLERELCITKSVSVTKKIRKDVLLRKQVMSKNNLSND